MIVTWEESDARPGRRIGKPGLPERVIVGFVFTGPAEPSSPSATSLTDGHTMIFESKAQLVEWLNNGAWQPEELL